MAGEDDENGEAHRDQAEGDPNALDKRKKRLDPNLWMLAGSGLELAAGIGVFCLIGWWLDRWLNTDPWLLVTGASLGFLGGIYNLWKQVNRYL